ncbi:MAG: glycoside hydrolase family 3 C-terminal domain-containing protein [Hyphomonadaceae bacterium]|nr:glycoside hydrolase family 3 C-terminal domain-containing protein [Hyphomonadaceae bacterium]
MGRTTLRGAIARALPLLAAGLVGVGLAGAALAQPRARPPVPAVQAAPVYKDAKAPVERRVEDLLSRMTLEEKVAQMLTLWQNKSEIINADLQFDRAKAKSNFPNGVGQIARPQDRVGADPPARVRHRGARESVAFNNAVQRWAVEDTRLGIPVLFHEESLHGFATADATSFPQAIALASSWDPALVQRVSALIAREVRARGVHLVLSPVVDVSRDPRWGRIEETFGEDPYLVGEIGVAAVRGLQGDTLPLAPGHVFATLKHMTGHGQPESGANIGPASISERTLREQFFPPFETIVRRTNVRSIMPSYNEIDGVPSHANRWLLHDVLRGEWGYRGALVSDYFAIEQLVDIHHVEPDYAAAAIRALRAGLDMDLPNGVAFRTLVDSVRAGRVREAEIDAAVRRILAIKFEAGLFENPYADADAAEAVTGNAEGRALAEEAARRTIVLLKNDGNLLPFNPASIRTLAVIGPNAAPERLGGYSGVPRGVVTALEGIQARVGPNVRVVHHEGVKITKETDWWADEVTLADPAENARLIREAVRVARRADHIILVIGDTEQTSREAWADNHLGDRANIDLVGQQNDLAAAILALNKPTAIVLLNGRPPSYPLIADRAKAIVEGWYLGQEGGTALAQVLFGDANPGGKLPLTVARHAGQLPHFYDRKPSARRGYLFEDNAPLFPFGWGLSYTTFELSAPRLSSASIRRDGNVQVSVDVRNTGARAGDEVVQLYIRDRVSSVTRPILELRGFERVTLAPGESRTVNFTLTPASLQFYDANMQRVVESGEFEIKTGPNSVQLQTAVLTVTE